MTKPGQDSIHAYRVAGHSFIISIDESINAIPALSHYLPFCDCINHGDQSLFNLHITNMSENKIPGFIKQDSNKTQYSDGTHLCFVSRNENGAPLAILLTNNQFSKGTLAIDKNARTPLIEYYIQMMYSMCVTPHNTMILHGVVVEYMKKGYIFIANGGTGKSTHARLWEKYIPNSHVICDDYPIVRKYPNGTTWVSGTPWDGKTPVYCNEMLPIGGIIQLAQAPSNSIRRVKGLDAFYCIWKRVQNVFYQEQTQKLHDTIIQIMSSIPVWHLDCLPNKEAVILCKESVTN